MPHEERLADGHFIICFWQAHRHMSVDKDIADYESQKTAGNWPP